MKSVRQKKQSPAMYAPREVKQEFPKFAKAGSVAKTKIQPIVNTTSIREDGLVFKTLPSHSTTGGSTAKKAETKYTGNSMLGVSITHKSNMVPVFDKDFAKEIANMRR